MWCILLWIYFVITLVSGWDNDEHSNKKTWTFGNDILQYPKHLSVEGVQSAVKLTYGRAELLNLKDYQYLHPSTCFQLRQCGVIRRKKRQRGKRGGKKKIIDKPCGSIVSNLITVETDQDLSRPHEMLSCLTLNCQSAVGKDVLIGQYLREGSFDFGVLTETWFTDEKSYEYMTSDLNSNGYRLNVQNRKNKRGGGVALVIKEGARFKRMKAGVFGQFEYVIWKIITKGTTINAIGLYRPPYTAKNRYTNDKFVSDFLEFCEDKIPDLKNIMFLGDFNLHIDGDEYSIQDFNTSLTAMGLCQHVYFSTHSKGNILDLCITEKVNGITVAQCTPGAFISDHRTVDIKIKIEKGNVIQRTIKSRNFKELDEIAFAADLAGLGIEDDLEVDSIVTNLECNLREIIDKHAPVKKKRVTIRKSVPWFSKEIKELKRDMRKKEKIWRTYQQDHQLVAFKAARSIYRNALDKKKVEVYSSKVEQYKGDAKSLYKLVFSLTGAESENPLPEDKNDRDLAEEFADFFIGKIENIRSSLAHHPNYKPTYRHCSQLTEFESYEEEEVKGLIEELNTKSCELDVLPTSVLKRFTSVLLPLLTKLVNISLREGVFPKQWKCAIIRPLIKKQGLDLICNNYRPVSNLSFLSKLLEKAALKRLNKHCSDNDLLPDQQSAYRKYFSCETCVLKLVSDLLKGMENKQVTGTILIDLSAAFDTVNWDILLEVLHHQYGLDGTALKWVDSYLRPRSCKVNIGASYSDPRSLSCSVPQGSCSGPWYFLTYAGTLFDEVQGSISLYGYADDHTASHQFNPSISGSEEDGLKQLENSAIKINSWMNKNKLKMNSSKTEFILVGSRQQLAKCRAESIDIVGDMIKRSSYVRYLGAWIDQYLTFDTHVVKKCTTAMINFLKIKSIRKYLTKGAAETLVLTMVMSHLDYCNSILYGATKKNRGKLQRIQNMCAKLVLGISKYESSKEALYNLHWLPIKARINFKIACIMFNCHNGMAPEYLIAMLKRKSPRYAGLRSGTTSEIDYEVPFNKKKTHNDRSFETSGPKVWNDLPKDVRLSKSYDQFKKNVKTYYFSNFKKWF